MLKQKIPNILKKVIWEVYGKKNGYENIPLNYSETEIDHIIPERVLLNPKEPDEFEKWKKKYNLDKGFNIRGIENFCPSTREFNLAKSHKGLHDKAGAYDKYIRKALRSAKELKRKIQEKYEEYQKRSDLRRLNPRINDLKDMKQLLEEKEIDTKTLFKTLNLTINRKELTQIEEDRKYNQILNKFRSNGISSFNYGEYLEIKDCIRYSYDEDNNNLNDVSFWIELIDEFINNISHDLLKKKLFYEKAFAMFKLFKIGESWKSIEIELRNYFKRIRNEKNLEVLEQAVNFCFGFNDILL